MAWYSGIMSASTRHPVFDYLLLGLLALLWGSSYLFIKVAVAEIPPLTLIAVRVSLAALFLLAVMAVFGIGLPRDARTWSRLLVQAFCNSIGAWTLLAWGQQYVDSGLASVLNSTAPIFVFFITFAITRHEPAGPVRLAGALLGVAGVVMIVGIDVLDGLGRSVAGQLAVLASAILYAFAAIHGRHFSHLSPVATAAGTMVVASIVLVPASLATDAPWSLSPSPAALGAALALAIGSTGLALLIYFRLVSTLGSLGVASQAYLRAGVGVALAVLVLGETLSPAVMLGLCAAIIGVIAINTSRS